MILPVEVQGKENVVAMCEAIVRHCAKIGFSGSHRKDDMGSLIGNAILAAFDLEEKK